ncbi:ribonuclease H-like domain-containing protein [Tanacetum coccineum]|uniref:Ribonuclease H-like domain-containing protein n=1 Tax=Tanacetum coccineum TaxID=301880 RepID=A0ABQ5E429_9ASTR
MTEGKYEKKKKANEEVEMRKKAIEDKRVAEEQERKRKAEQDRKNAKDAERLRNEEAERRRRNAEAQGGGCSYRPASVNMVRSMWLLKHKFHADGTLSRYKARLVANSSSQQLGVYFDETLSLRSLYGLKQAPCAWFQRFAGYATRAGFYHIRYDSSLFICRQGSQVAYLLIYVDDIILTASSLALLKHIIASLHKEFDMTDSEHLIIFLLYASATTSLDGYTNADWAGCPFTRRSTSGYCVFLGDNLLSWSAKCQHTLSCSSAKAKYRGVANVLAETAWLRNLLRELHSPLLTATLVYCDNISSVYMSANPVQYQWTKHIEIDIHFVRDMVTAGEVRVLHVPSCYQYDDIFTKGLPSALFCLNNLDPV